MNNKCAYKGNDGACTEKIHKDGFCKRHSLAFNGNYKKLLQYHADNGHLKDATAKKRMERTLAYYSKGGLGRYESERRQVINLVDEMLADETLVQGGKNYSALIAEAKKIKPEFFEKLEAGKKVYW